ncbi:MAG: helix-turn-helix domain-containing protein [Bacteroidota bacterium]|nr:helix-turn-helix domain-containing protein [Bacteroidota bacterium]
MKKFGVRLKSLLKERGYSIKEFAIKIKMSEIGLHNAIKANSTKLETIEKIAQELNVSISYFFKSDEELKIELISSEKEVWLKSLNDEYITQIQNLHRDLQNQFDDNLILKELIDNAIINGVDSELFVNISPLISKNKNKLEELRLDAVDKFFKIKRELQLHHHNRTFKMVKKFEKKK